MPKSSKFQSFQVPSFQIQLNLSQIGSLNFNLNSVMNFEKFQYLFVFFEFGKTRFEPLQFELFFKNRIN
jgi:hypothetical protein